MAKKLKVRLGETSKILADELRRLIYKDKGLKNRKNKK